MGQTTSKNTTNHKNKPKSISKLFHAQTGSIWFQIGSYLVPIGSYGFSSHRSVPTNLKWFPNCSPAQTLFQDRFKDVQVGSRWFRTLHILSPNFHTKRSSHDASGSKLGIVWPSIFQRNWGGPLLGVQGQCFTAPKMRFCSDLFLPKLAQLWRTAVLLQVQKAPQCPTATPSIIAKGPQQ